MNVLQGKKLNTFGSKADQKITGHSRSNPERAHGLVVATQQPGRLTEKAEEDRSPIDGVVPSR